MFGILSYFFYKYLAFLLSIFNFYQNLFKRLFDFFFPNFDPEKAQEKLKFAKSMGFVLLKKSILHIFVLFHCYFIAFVLYASIYWYLIPKMHQEGQLNFSKSKSHGYLTTFINNNNNNNLCVYHFEKSVIEFEDSFNLTRKQICQSSFKQSEDNMVLYKEYYSLKLDLVLPESDNNYDRGTFSINSYVINNQGEILKIPKIASMHKNKNKFLLFSLFDRFMVFIGLREHVKIMEIFLENIPNHLVDIQALVINIPDSELIIFDSKLKIETKLFGFRYYLYYWFFICLFIIVNIVALSIFTFCFVLINFIPFIPKLKEYAVTYIKSKNF